jgi:hypothetical protein
VLEHVGGDDDVEVRPDLGRETVVQVGLDEGVEAFADVRVLDPVDADDVMPRVAHELAEPAVGAPDVEHGAGGSLPDPCQQPAVRRVRGELELVLVRGEGELTRPEPELVEAIPGDVDDVVLGVTNAVDAADLVMISVSKSKPSELRSNGMSARASTRYAR